MKLNDYTLLFKRVLFGVLLLASTKIFFFLFNQDYFIQIKKWEMLASIWQGLRLDFAAGLLVLSPFIIFSLLPIRTKIFNKLLAVIFYSCLGLALILHIIDWEFFSFFGKKLTFDIVYINEDIKDQAFQLMEHYWYLIVFVSFYFILLIKFYPQDRKRKLSVPVSLWATPFIGFLLLCLTFIGIRGGVQLKSIDIKDAFVFDSHELGNLNLPASYSFLRTIKKDVPRKIKFYENRESVLSNIKKERVFLEGRYKKHNANIIILIVESLSQQYMDDGFTPFLADIAQKSFKTEWSFANGRRSIEALPSILAGFPSIIGIPLYQSPYQANKYYALPELLRKNGYETSFFHGGKTGTMEFDSYVKTIGVQNYFGMENYFVADYFDGHWGIYDHYFLDFFHKKINEMRKPFFATFFSLSSHQPYSIPSQFQNIFPKGNLDIHESIGYADYSLKIFFDNIKKEPWFKDTFFIITGDHTQKLKGKKFNTLLGRYQVPIIFYDPERNLSKENRAKKVSQHADILPTVLDVLGLQAVNKLLYGSSVFNTDPGRMINLDSETYLFVANGNVLEFQDELKRVQKLDGSGAKRDKYLEAELKALIQYTKNGLIENNIYQN